MNEWPIPFDEELVDVPSAYAPLATLASLAAGPSPQAGPLSAAFSAGMAECKHLLPESQCTWCNGHKHLEVEEPRWEQKDYVETLEAKSRQLKPQSEVDHYVLDPREIYGTQVGLRIKQTLRERSV